MKAIDLLQKYMKEEMIDKISVLANNKRIPLDKEVPKNKDIVFHLGILN